MRTRKKSIHKQTGGMVSSPAAFQQGRPWSMPYNLPGEGANVSEVGNFFAFNTNGGALPDPIDTDNFYIAQTKIGGGRKRSRKKNKLKRKKTKKHIQRKKTKKRKYRGGSRDRLFQNIVNGSRNAIFGAGDLVNQWQGKTGQLSPSPTVQNLDMSDIILINEPPDLQNIQQAAGETVSNI